LQKEREGPLDGRHRMGRIRRRKEKKRQRERMHSSFQRALEYPLKEKVYFVLGNVVHSSEKCDAMEEQGESAGGIHNRTKKKIGSRRGTSITF